MLVTTACGDDSGPKETEGQPPASPSTTVAATTEPTTTEPATTGVAETTGEELDACCMGEGEEMTCSACPDASQVCATRRVTGQTPVAADFACQAECVGELAAAYWCGDDSSCCDADATCDRLTGVCTVPTDTTSGSGDASEATGAGTDAATDGTTAAATE